MALPYVFLPFFLFMCFCDPRRAEEKERKNEKTKEWKKQLIEAQQYNAQDIFAAVLGTGEGSSSLQLGERCMRSAKCIWSWIELKDTDKGSNHNHFKPVPLICPPMSTVVWKGGTCLCTGLTPTPPPAMMQKCLMAFWDSLSQHMICGGTYVGLTGGLDCIGSKPAVWNSTISINFHFGGGNSLQYSSQ